LQVEIQTRAVEEEGDQEDGESPERAGYSIVVGLPCVALAHIQLESVMLAHPPCQCLALFSYFSFAWQVKASQKELKHLMGMNNAGATPRGS